MMYGRWGLYSTKWYTAKSHIRQTKLRSFYKKFRPSQWTSLQSLKSPQTQSYWCRKWSRKTRIHALHSNNCIKHAWESRMMVNRKLNNRLRSCTLRSRECFCSWICWSLKSHTMLLIMPHFDRSVSLNIKNSHRNWWLCFTREDMQ